MTKLLLVAALTATLPLSSAHAGPNACVRTVNTKGVSRTFCAVSSGDTDPNGCRHVDPGYQLRPLPWTEVCVNA